MRLRPFYLLAALIAWGGSCGIGDVHCQEEPAEVAAQPPSSADPVQTDQGAKPGAPLERSPLDEYRVRDENGKLVPVVGMTYEEFEQLLKFKRGLAPPAPPPYSLDSLAITGSAAAKLANLQVTARIRVRAEGAVGVPLRFNNAVLREGSSYEGSGEHFVGYDEKDGYVCWLFGPHDKPHVVKLNLTVPVSELGTQSRLETILPRGTESSLKLLVPLAKAEAQLQGSGEGLASVREVDGKSEIEVLGAGGELSLLWRASQGMTPGARAVLEAGGEVIVKVEGRNRVSSEARLTVRSLSGPLQTFRVRLPPKMEMVPSNPSGYSVTLVEPASGATRAEIESPLVEIRFDRPVSTAAEIRLVAALAPQADTEAKPQSAIAPARFEVVSAVRQRGTIDFSVDGDWSLTWTQDAGTRRVENPPAAVNVNHVARFEYFRQPCNLKVAIEPRPTRIAVEPTYVIFVEPKLLRLEATLKYRIRGAGTQSLAVAMGDWTFAKVEPETDIEVESLDPTAQSLVLPLRSRAAAGELEIRLQAHKLLPEGSTDLTFLLPRPMADIVTPASVIVVPADNVELTAKVRDILGLVADSQPPTVNLPPRQQPPLVYRDRGAGGEARFVGQSQIRTRQTTVAASARVQFSQRAAQVEQRLAYRILYEPQRTFRLQIPRSILARGDLKVLLVAEAIPVIPLAESDSESSRLARVQVTAATEQIGPCELTVQYTLPVPRIAAGEPVTIAIPLVIPDEEVDQAELGQTITAQWADALQVELAAVGSAAAAGPTAESTLRGELRATSSALAAEWRFQLRTSDPAQSSRLTVSKMWLRSLLLGDVRQERATWRLSTGSSTLRIVLPPGAQVENDQIAINKQRAVGRLDGNVLTVPLAPSASEMVVEVWYTLPQPGGTAAASLASLIPPIVEGAGQVRHCYWQICLPGREHMIAEPAGFTPELAWQWRGSYWERLGTLDQTALEDWIGASNQATLPADMNAYLFSTFRSPAAMPVVRASRSVLLWSIGAAVLLVGLLVLNVRAVRRPSVLLALGVVLIAAGLSWPTTALLVAQGSSVAFLIVLFAALWQWSLTGHTPYAPPAASSPAIAPVEAKSTATSPPPRSESPPATTATAPLAAMTEPQP